MDLDLGKDDKMSVAVGLLIFIACMLVNIDLKLWDIRSELKKIADKKN